MSAAAIAAAPPVGGARSEPSPYEHHGEIIEGVAYPAPMDDSDRPMHPTPEEMAHHSRLAETDRHAHAMHPLARLTRSDLERALPRMPGLPVLYEHGGYEVGSVVHGRIDPQTGALVVVMRIRDEATRRLLRSGAARSLSPSYTITRDPTTGRTDVDITEISVVRRPLLADCTVRVVASAETSGTRRAAPSGEACWWDALMSLPLPPLAETAHADVNVAREARVAKVTASDGPNPNAPTTAAAHSTTTTTTTNMSTNAAAPAAETADAPAQPAAQHTTAPAQATAQSAEQGTAAPAQPAAGSTPQQQQQQPSPQQFAQLREAFAKQYEGADQALLLDRLVTLEAMSHINDRVENERYSRMGAEAWDAMKQFAHENGAIREIQERTLATMFQNHHGRRVADLVHGLVGDRARQMEQVAAAQKLLEEVRSAYSMSDNARLGQLLGVSTSVAASAEGQAAAKRQRPNDPAPSPLAGHNPFYVNWKPAPAPTFAATTAAPPPSTTAFQPFQTPPSHNQGATPTATAASASVAQQPHQVGVAASDSDPQTESYFSERGVPADGFDFLAFSQANL